jgi:hypothetical protein
MKFNGSVLVRAVLFQLPESLQLLSVALPPFQIPKEVQ